MKRFYSQTTGCTYIEGLHKVMPSDVKVITDERYLEVIGNPVSGKLRSHDPDGLPILIDPPPEDPAVAARAWRDVEITRVQWIRDRHRDEQDLARETTITAEQFAELLDYMQALRDWPISPAFPDPQGRPLQPTWAAQMLVSPQ
ncbi:phage tail assembly chaperone [Pseudomonas reactans]|uniref:phage tail assembly chaperone n=1 Tax=Pseudomonas reactans TaxID=117680 RepID=UPI0015A0335F|nr:phage tail assembly chaperone [Pseudomonas reactans]NWA69007.1 phage tail protein [Pseudomonas reactans]